MGSRSKIVISLYDASTTFNVAVQYLQYKHWRCLPEARCILYMRTLIFPINSILYKSAYYSRDLTVC